MSDNKKYYYLKLKENFFDSDEMIILESMPDGVVYSNILLKLYLRSLKNEGRLMFNERIPFNSTMLSQVTRQSVGDVEKAVQLFKELGLIEIMDNGAIYMTEIQNFIGRSSTEADRKREFRARIENEKLGISYDGQMSGQMSDKNPPEIELEIEKELEIKKDTLSSKHDTAPYSKIINYLNDQTGKKYKVTDKWKKLIQARLNEGQTYDDFIKVIDTKVKQWKNDAKMNQYLRPQTLFGNKFDEYLNEYVQPVNNSRDHEFEETQRKLREIYEQ